MSEYEVGDLIKYETKNEEESTHLYNEYDEKSGVIQSIHRWTDKRGNKICFHIENGDEVSLISIIGKYQFIK